MDLSYLNELRQAELREVLVVHGLRLRGVSLLEVGAGTGAQLEVLREACSSVVGVDLPNGPYSAARVGDVTDYDGATLPFPDAHFDIVYSSSVMEHLLDEQGLHEELQRVLRPGGACIHVVPGTRWSLLTMLAHYPNLLLTSFRRISRGSQPRTQGEEMPGTPMLRPLADRIADVLWATRHGERGNRFTEWAHFSRRAWTRRFESLGWHVQSARPVGFLYSGYAVLGSHLSLGARRGLARALGSSCWMFLLERR